MDGIDLGSMQMPAEASGLAQEVIDLTYDPLPASYLIDPVNPVNPV